MNDNNVKLDIIYDEEEFESIYSDFKNNLCSIENIRNDIESGNSKYSDYSINAKNLVDMYESINDMFKTIIDNNGYATSSIFELLDIYGEENDIFSLNNAISIYQSLLASGLLGQIPFDSNFFENYGANQEAPSALLERYLINPESLNETELKQIEYIIKAFQKANLLSSKEPDYYYKILDKSKYGSCGLAATANLEILIYNNMENGNERFEEIHGFPICFEDSSGNRIYNFNANHSYMVGQAINNALHYAVGDGSFTPQLIIDASAIGKSAILSKGLMPIQLKPFIESLSNDYVDVRTTSINYSSGQDTSFSNFYLNNSSEHDYTILAAHDFVLKPVGVSSSLFPNNYSVDFGHAMIVTGMSADNNPVVSTWGLEMEVLECERCDFIFVDCEYK